MKRRETPGEIVCLDSLPGLKFSSRSRGSFYDHQIEQLAALPPNYALKVASKRMRDQLVVRAHKRGLVFESAVHDGAIYVRIARDERIRSPAAVDGGMAILRAIAVGFDSPVTIADYIVRAGGNMTPSRALESLERMQRAGYVRKAADGAWKMTSKVE